MPSRPVLLALAGALAIAFTGVLVRLADVEPATAAFWRCAYALPFLAPLAWLERRRRGALGARRHALAAAAGVFFAADLELWHHSIAAVGAGLSTVVANLQVVVVGFVAWLVLGERPEARVLAAVPVALGGVVLISGLGSSAAYGDDPTRGVVFALLTAVAYAGFLLVIREAGRGLRTPAEIMLDATAACAVALAVIGGALGELALAPSWPAHGWLLTLAVSGQVVGYLAIAASLPRLPALVVSVLLLVQPVLSVMLAAAIVDERPSGLQVLGVVLVVAGIVVATAGGRREREAAVPAEA
ncbi:MAG TPA: EamA family transporter [Gaiellaceae bacterium]|nr:EamA family transporter [Gaiellaceae bacterium]